MELQVPTDRLPKVRQWPERQSPQSTNTLPPAKTREFSPHCLRIENPVIIARDWFPCRIAQKVRQMPLAHEKGGCWTPYRPMFLQPHSITRANGSFRSLCPEASQLPRTGST